MATLFAVLDEATEVVQHPLYTDEAEALAAVETLNTAMKPQYRTFTLGTITFERG